MEIISSAQNQHVKLAKSLLEMKFRKETGLFLAEGKNLLKDLPDCIRIEYVFSTEQRFEEASLLHARHEGSSLFVVTDSVMQSLADTKTPYGIVAVCKIPSAVCEAPKGNAILLDGVADPGNVGTIFRSAAACGYDAVYLVDSVDVYSPKVVRATLGGLFRVKFYVIDVETAKALIQSTNSAVLDMDGENILTASIEKPILLIAGNEAHGVRDDFARLAKHTYSLPMQNGVESLNVAVAASVAMYRTV